MQPYETIVDRLPSLIYLRDGEGRLLYGNRSFFALFEDVCETALAGRVLTDHLPRDTAEVFLAEDARAVSAAGKTESVCTIGDRQRRSIILNTCRTPYLSREGEPRLLAVSEDVTARVDREHRLGEFVRHLQAFSAMAAHDLRSPLSAISGTLRLIQRDRETTLSACSAERIAALIALAEQLGDGIASLLDAVRLDHCVDDLPTTPCDLNVLVADATSRLSSAFERSGAVFRCCDLPTISVEANLFRHLVQNLLENSIKYAAPDVAPVMTMRYHLGPDAHVFSIEDNGRGIATAAPLAFELYEQARTAGIAGCGLGLALCKKIVEVHGGRIWHDARHVGGCRIAWSLPVRRIGSFATDLPRDAAALRPVAAPRNTHVPLRALGDPTLRCEAGLS